MKTKHLVIAAVFALAAAPAPADTPQQERMKACNADAGKQQLKGDARKQFMKQCLSSKKQNTEADQGPSAPEAAEDREVAQPNPAAQSKRTAQQQRMKSCNAKASAKSLKGEERKKFMKSCLSAG
ncbi:MAG TPA: PsiF family protein [Burkholderiales bacterium]|jgi:hypothetical protein|nr:PsiF family protein [Burkholderiales bacterium]